jgi:hypothetical protein
MECQGRAKIIGGVKPYEDKDGAELDDDLEHPPALEAESIQSPTWI